MKRIYLSALSAFLATSILYGQGEMDAFKLSRNDLTGTARTVSMGGAFGALGGDISAISINPAGIGIYQSSEVVTTINFQNTKTSADMANPNQSFGSYDHSKFNFSFDNLGFVGTFPLYSDVAPLLNFGFSYNRLKTFDRKYEIGGNWLSNSITDFMATRANGHSPNQLFWEDNNNNAWGNDWFAVLGYNAGFINPDDPRNPNQSQNFRSSVEGLGLNNNLFVREKGFINTYDFNMGTTFSNILSAGVTVSVTDIRYRMFSYYAENYFEENGTNAGGMDMRNELKTDGTGWQVSTGLIFKPIHELRIGVAYHSPTWYRMTDIYTMSTNYDFYAWVNNQTSEREQRKGRISSPQGRFDYELRTPDKWTFSLAGVIGQYGIISVDYELTNYKNNMRLFENNGGELFWGQNTYIEQDFRNASTLRIGFEGRITPQFSARVGYAWMQSPLEKDFKDNTREVIVTEPNAHYVLDGDINHITWGLGYRFTKNFYTDIAFVVKSQKSDLYSFPRQSEKNDRAELKTDTFQGLLTLGYKF